MRKFESQKQFKSRIYSRTTLIVLLVMIIFLSKGVFNIYIRNEESIAARDDSRLKVAELSERKKLLGDEIQKLNQDAGIEKEIREKFNVVKPGENVVLIIPDDDATSTPEQKSFIRSFWEKVW